MVVPSYKLQERAEKQPPADWRRSAKSAVTCSGGNDVVDYERFVVSKVAVGRRCIKRSPSDSNFCDVPAWGMQA